MSEATSEPIFRGRFAGGRDRARLSAQIEQIRAWALRVDWFTLRDAREQLERLYAPSIFLDGSISAQLRNLKKRSAGRLRSDVQKRRRDGARNRRGGIWEYRVRLLAPASEPRAETAAPLEKIKWPATFDELEAAGYEYFGAGKKCACGVRFLWWIIPNGKFMPLSTVEDLRSVPHRAVCENAKRIRVANSERDARADPRPVQAALF